MSKREVEPSENGSPQIRDWPIVAVLAVVGCLLAIDVITNLAPSVGQYLKSYSGVTALLTFGLLIVAAVQAVLFINQLKVMSRATDAAVSANELNRQIFLATERPWVSIEITGPFTAKLRRRGADSVDFTVRLKNVGKSPAQDVRIYTMLFPLSEPVTVQTVNLALRHPFQTGEIIPFGVTLFPGDEHEEKRTRGAPWISDMFCGGSPPFEKVGVVWPPVPNFSLDNTKLFKFDVIADVRYRSSDGSMQYHTSYHRMLLGEPQTSHTEDDTVTLNALMSGDSAGYAT